MNMNPMFVTFDTSMRINAYQCVCPCKSSMVFTFDTSQPPKGRLNALATKKCPPCLSHLTHPNRQRQVREENLPKSKLSRIESSVDYRKRIIRRNHYIEVSMKYHITQKEEELCWKVKFHSPSTYHSFSPPSAYPIYQCVG